MKKHNKKGQTILEYTILLIIIMAVFISMQMYVKRGIQGRWRATIDDMGDQYDPRLANTHMTYTVQSNSSTRIRLREAGEGNIVTLRHDETQSKERRRGQVVVGAQFGDSI